MSASDDIDYLDLLTPSATVVHPPIRVTDAADWDDECDMLVLGAGLAGAATALKGAEIGGLDIVIADRFRGGGTSALSGGVVYAGGGTRVQREQGIEDSPDGLAEYLAREAEELRSPDTLRRFAEASPAMIDWLEAQGVAFDGPVFDNKASYPPAPYFLYYSGNEKAMAYAGQYPPAPRGHRAKSANPAENATHSAGAVLMAGVGRKVAADPAIRSLFQASARRLVTDDQGRVIGAELWKLPDGSRAAARHRTLYAWSRNPRLSVLGLTVPLWNMLARLERRHARPYRVRARRGVVIAAGGFGHNGAMRTKAAPIYSGARTIGSVGDDGSSVRLGQSVGAALGQMHLLSPWRFISPPISWIKGIVVDGAAQRIVNEELYGARIGDALFEKANGRAWLIVDAETQIDAKRDLADPSVWTFQRLPAEVVMRSAKSAATIVGLEVKLGFPKGSLVAMVERYNRDIAEGRADQFQKSEQFRRPLLQGPFFAMDIGTGTKLNPVGSITLGGLKVDERTNAVLGRDGAPIAGLFAAGRAAVGMCSNNYVSGLSLADCVWSGWQAAIAVAGSAAGESSNGNLGDSRSERSSPKW